MIITGKSIAFYLDLVAHLLDDVSENTRVEALEYRDVAIWEVEPALRDMQILCAGTMGTKGLYHAKIRPAPEYSLPHEQWFTTADILEQELGLDDQPRLLMLHEQEETGLIVKAEFLFQDVGLDDQPRLLMLHEQEDRARLHAIWARTDLETMTLRPDSFTYRAHERAARAIEAALGHETVPGRHDSGISDPGAAP